MPETTSVLVIDDHPLFRRGVSQLLALEPGYQVAGEAASGEEGIALARQLDPDLILLDLNMKGLNGLETLQRLRDTGIDARIVVLTVSNLNEDVINAIRAGADGYVLKDSEPEDILAMLRTALEGRTALSPELASVLASALREEQVGESRRHASLTDRESTILQCLAAGLSNKLIARELNITEGTVKVHIRSLLRKLKFRSRLEAAVWAVATQQEG